jgi:hypothetical protein
MAGSASSFGLQSPPLEIWHGAIPNAVTSGGRCADLAVSGIVALGMRRTQFPAGWYGPNAE